MNSAAAAATEHGVGAHFDNPIDLANHQGVDLVVVSVKVPEHREIVEAVVGAGKPVFCEWPLAAGHEEAKALARIASRNRNFIGLQARSSPALRYLRDLVADGFIGEVLSTTVVASGVPWGTEIGNRTTYLLDRANGATMMSIPFGHTVDAIAMVLGDLVEIKATTALRREKLLNVQSGHMVPTDVEDQIAVSGRLVSGAVVSIHYRGRKPIGPTAFWWEINGTRGDLALRTDSGMVQLGKTSICGTNEFGRTFEELPVPDAYNLFPGLDIHGPANSLAHSYRAIVHDLRSGDQTVPDFGHATRLHHLLNQVEASARMPGIDAAHLQ